MKILIISPGIHPVPPVKGGAVENLIDFILKDNINRKDYEIDCISIFDKEAQKASLNYKNVKFIFLNTDSFIDKINMIYFRLNRKIFNRIVKNPYVRKTYKYLKNNKFYDYIIVENEAEFGVTLKKVVKGKMILHLHNDFINVDNKNSVKLIDSYYKIICVSNFIKNRIDEVKKNDKTIILLNGVDKQINNNNVNIDEIIKKYKLNPKKKIIIFSGRVCKDKGVRELITAYINSNIKEDYQLLICGGHNYGTSELDDYIKNLKIMSKEYDVIFTGFVPYEEMYKLYNISQIGVIPSIINEACPLTAIEMLTAGLPIIYSDSGGLPEIVNLKCGCLVHRKNIIPELKESINYLCTLSNSEYEKMSNNSKKRSYEFTKEKYLNNFFDFINKIGGIK